MPIISPPVLAATQSAGCPAQRNDFLSNLAPQWFHPLLSYNTSCASTLTRHDLSVFAYDFYQRFLPFFSDQVEGSLASGVKIEFTTRMRQKLGLAFLFEHKIRLNQTYFAKEPSLLPYALFHELTHLWLYDCLLDPGHTHRFYKKMAEFESTGLPIDADLHVHTRIAPEGKHVYICPNCRNRWYLRERLQHPIFCGHCFDREGVEYYARSLKITRQQSGRAVAMSDSAA